MKGLYYMGKLVPKEDIMSLSEYYKIRYRETGNSDYHFLVMADDIRNSAVNYTNMRVGCVIVKDEKIISSGYNDKGIHAEWNAIKKCMENNISIRDAIIYINLQPCLACAHLIIASKIKKVVYESKYSEKDADCKLCDTDKLLEDNCIESICIVPPFLENLIRMENSKNWTECTIEEYKARQNE